jgi:zinc transport system substrate-binding protein
MKRVLVLTAMLMIVAGCSGETGEPAVAEPGSGGKPLVCTTTYPLQYFVERIAAPVADVRFPLPGDGDPAYWSPTPDDVLEMQQADLIVLNGASYETWLENVSLPPSRMVDSTAALEERLIPLVEATTHSHGLEGEHEHSGIAFTTWLDPALAAEQARAIKVALAEHWPRHAGRFESQLAALAEDLTALDAAIGEAVAGNNRLPVIFSHPVYQYLTRRYGLNARSLHWEPDQAPDDAAWRELAAILEEFPARWMIWEERPLPQVSDRLESLGVRSVVFDPCANTPPGGDFLSVMEENLQALRLVFAPESPPAGG